MGSPPSGYPASSLPERIYGEEDRYGLLVYTGSLEKGMRATAIRGEPSGRPASGRGRSRSARMRPGKRGVQALEGEDPWHRRRAERRRRGGSTLEPARSARACASMGCQTRAGRTARLPWRFRPRPRGGPFEGDRGDQVRRPRYARACPPAGPAGRSAGVAGEVGHAAATAVEAVDVAPLWSWSSAR